MTLSPVPPTGADALRISEAHFRAMSDASPLGLFVSDAEGYCVYTNAAYGRISGLSFEQSLGENWSTAIHPEDRQRVLADWRAAAHGGAPFQTEFRFLRDDGQIVWTRVHGAALLEGGRVNGHIQTVEDISERKATDHALRIAEEALFVEKERLRVTLDSIGDAVLTTDLRGRITFMNPVAEAMTGWSLAEALGLPLTTVFRLVDVATHQHVADPGQHAIAENRIVGLATDCALIRRDGSESAIEDSAAPIHNRDGEVTGAVIVFHDVNESRALTQKMAHQAHHDFLTGLPNRALLTERLVQAIRLAKRHRKQVGLLFLDLDHFKHINDSLGHAVGDQLLQSVARRLTTCVRASDTICRQGGDEFVILLAEIAQPQDAAQVAESLLAALAPPHRLNEHELRATTSIGISVYPCDGLDADALLQNADTAMYHAKAEGRDNYQFFKAEMNARAVHRQLVESSLRRALEKGEFLLHYQPKINLESSAMTGAEALIRWQDPALGLVQPAQFITVAEECGLILDIGRWVLREACTQVRAWLDAGLAAVPVAVNVSATEFRHRDFLAGVARVLQETGLDPRYLELELTESLLMHDSESSASVLDALRTLGIRLAIDDFGTGYSSLSYLSRFPIDTLKIDRSFVHDLAADAGDAAIVGAVIDMGKNLNQRVVAEGVEMPEQLAFLHARQCDEGQGFLFGPPVPALEFARQLAPAPPA